MGGKAAVEHFIQTGYFATDREFSPKHSSLPVQANQSSKLGHIPRSLNPALLRRFPPPPSVEDEVESLAKEHGGLASPVPVEEEPKYRGAVEQLPILVPVPEHNSERRFVLLKPSSKNRGEGLEESDDSVEENTDKRRSSYEANTCRKFTISRADEEVAEKKLELKRQKSRPDLPRIQSDEEVTEKKSEIRRQRSRLDLPRIQTDIHTVQPSSSPSLHRTRSATYIDKRRRDYPELQERQQGAGDNFLSPSIIKHATKGRDRAYFDFNPGSTDGINSRTRQTDQKVKADDRRNSTRYERSLHSVSPAPFGRSNSAVEPPTSARRSSEKYSVRDEPSSPRPGKTTTSPPSRNRKTSPPPQFNRRTSSPPREREKRARANSSYSKRRDSSPRREENDYSDEERSKSTRPRQRDRRKSIVSQEERGDSTLSRRKSIIQDDRGSTLSRRKSIISHDDRGSTLSRRKSVIHQEDSGGLLSPDLTRPSMSGRPKSRSTTPLASPRIHQGQFPDSELAPNSRASATFPLPKARRQHDERSHSPFSSGSSSPPRQLRLREEDKPKGPRPRSRASSFIGAPVVIPGPVTTPPGSPIERRRSPMPPQRQASLASSPPESDWQPSLEMPLARLISSYRRYSEDVTAGVAPDFPPCPRRTAEAGYSDWFTLPRCDNFNVCPSCYAAVFANTEFRTHLVPASFRPRDVKIACDLGSSHWLRIAWLMTNKTPLPDLRLLKGIADATAQHQPCHGRQLVNRNWYSLLDPSDYFRPIPHFDVCSTCYTSIEVLFPNLVGIFQPSHSPGEVVSTVCAMHFSPDRPRFVQYFDILEATSDRSLATRSPPDIKYLAHNIHRWASVEECPRSNMAYNMEFYTMALVPAMTVCKDCFADVVHPETKLKNPIASNFYKRPVLYQRGTCQLYSQRMRGIFSKACQRNDMEYLEAKTIERRRAEDRFQRLMEDIQSGRPRELSAGEEQKVVEEWKSWES